MTVDDFIALYTRSFIFCSHGCNKFLHARTLFTLTDSTSIPMFAMYLHARIFCTLARSLLFPWVQCRSLKPVLSQCSQTCFVTVDDFIALYTCSYVFYSHGCNKFLHVWTFFTLAYSIAPIFTVITEVWPRANPAVATNIWLW